MNFAARHTAMFKAMAPTAPAGSAALTGPIVDLPTHYICYAQDVTVAYAGNCVPQYNVGPKKALRDVTIQTIEEGHHSYGQASAQQVIFEFFDDVLAGASNNDVQTVHFTTGVAVAEVTDSTGQKTQVPLATVPAQKDGQLMVGLADLAKIYGRTFHAYDVYAYNTDPNSVVRVIAVKYNHVMVNIKKDDTFLRVGGTIRVGDTRSGTTKVQPGDPDIDPRTDLSVAPYGVGADVVVPVVEFMNLFGKTAIAD